ncbi:MAG: hypothetical protein DHS20C10_05160 [marine bacterium B5-7]|nr:MAG: hypothetical protein DHS20C10_05160 [marine bacterium B5-7]
MVVNEDDISTLYRIIKVLLEIIPPSALAGAAIQTIKTQTGAPVLAGLSAAVFFVRQGVRHHQKRRNTQNQRKVIYDKAKIKVSVPAANALNAQHFPALPWHRRIGRYSWRWEGFVMPIAIVLMMTFSIMLEMTGTPKETTTGWRNDSLTGRLMQTLSESLVTDLPQQMGGRVSDLLIAFFMYWYQYMIALNVDDEASQVDKFERSVNDEMMARADRTIGEKNTLVREINRFS